MSEHLNKRYILGADVGGSHISSALVDINEMCILESSLFKGPIDAQGDALSILKTWGDILKKSLNSIVDYSLVGMSIAIPGPFDYANGVSLISDVNKYEEIFGINIGEFLRHMVLPTYEKTSSMQYDEEIQVPILFENDASCYGIGESNQPSAAKYNKLLAITLGTGFGSSFIANNLVLKKGAGIPKNGELYSVTFKDGIAEDYISSKWLTKEYRHYTGNSLTPRQIAKKAIEEMDAISLQVFEQFGKNLGECLIPIIQQFNPDGIVIGGSIARSAELFVPSVREILKKSGIIECDRIYTSTNTEKSAIIGAVANLKSKILKMQENTVSEKNTNKKNDFTLNEWRLTSQKLLPLQLEDKESLSVPSKDYDCYPFTSIGENQIFSGYDSLAEWMAKQQCIMIDGFIGNDWSYIRKMLSDALIKKGIKPIWYEMSSFQKDATQIDSLLTPFLGTPDSVWGTKATLTLSEFYKLDRLKKTAPVPEFDLSIIIGVGAALAEWNCPIVYIDLPKNELQYRMRAGSALNLGEFIDTDISKYDYAERYKRSYFVDWVVLAKHRQSIKNGINIVVDGQWKMDITWSHIQSINKGLSKMTQDAFRVRPWFEAGSWGGQWLKKNFKELPQNEVNYAWSFELITPENGIVFESDRQLLEISFDWLMEFDADAVIGKRDAARFGLEFPIRFDFLDTFDGGNLSIQCHPTQKYIQQKFGEKITQDETYYILDCKPDAKVYLGFKDDIQPDKFRKVLEESAQENIPIKIEDYIQVHPAHKHDLFLIPNGTVHSSGKNNLVLEISATPYIFTFKMYDWLSLDLNGSPRPINIEHAFKNLDFTRKGTKVIEELISKPFLKEEGAGYQIISLPTHSQHFYTVCRLEFNQQIHQHTNDRAHVLMLVEGSSIIIQTKYGEKHRFHYGETIVIPANAISYQIINEQPSMQVKVIQAFVK